MKKTMLLLIAMLSLTSIATKPIKPKSSQTSDRDILTNKMIFIKGGTFIMGASKEEKGGGRDEKPDHEITISDFYLSRYEVTFLEYDTYCEALNLEKPNDSGWGRGERPVINVSWNDAMEYCKWLSNKTGKKYRLPTEAEWEYACRAGTTTPYSMGNILISANYGKLNGKTIYVGSFAPNPWGLYDMHGNVWEWCSDYYGDDYYEVSPNKDPEGPKTGTLRIGRGGGWYDVDLICRSASRQDFAQTYSINDLGFRLAMSAE